MLAAGGAALCGCATKVDRRADKAAVEAGLQRYSQLLLAMDSSGIAATASVTPVSHRNQPCACLMR